MSEWNSIGGFTMGLISNTPNDKKSDNSARTYRVLPEPVYYVFSPQDDTVLVGIDVIVRKSNNNYIVSWWDPTHERVMTALKITCDSDYFAFKRMDREGGQLYFFIPMDLDIYYKRVKRFLISGRDFDTKEEMIKAFHDAEGNW